MEKKILDGFKVKIGPAFYTISVSPLLKTEEIEGDNNFQFSKIRIDSSIPPKRSFYVLWHEIFHGVLETICPYTKEEAHEEEKMVERLSFTITDTLINTPGFLEKLIELRDYKE